jgi:hypothetical protein
MKPAKTPVGGGVELLLQGGTLERAGRSTPLREAGYRLLLPNLDEADLQDLFATAQSERSGG